MSRILFSSLLAACALPPIADDASPGGASAGDPASPPPAGVADLAPPAPWYYADAAGDTIDLASLRLVGREVAFRTLGGGLESGDLSPGGALAALACPGREVVTRLVLTFEAGSLADSVSVPREPCVEGAAWAIASELASLGLGSGRVADAQRWLRPHPKGVVAGGQRCFPPRGGPRAPPPSLRDGLLDYPRLSRQRRERSGVVDQVVVLVLDVPALAEAS